MVDQPVSDTGEDGVGAWPLTTVSSISDPDLADNDVCNLFQIFFRESPYLVWVDVAATFSNFRNNLLPALFPVQLVFLSPAGDVRFCASDELGNKLEMVWWVALLKRPFSLFYFDMQLNSMNLAEQVFQGDRWPIHLPHDVPFVMRIEELL